MEIIKAFDFNGKQLMVCGNSDRAWFKAKDIAHMLEYDDTKLAIKTNIDTDDIITCEKLRGELGTPLEKVHPMTKFTNESGLYALIFGSKKKEAKKFKRWVTSVVLPSIRKTGKFDMVKPNAYITLPSQINLNSERDYRIKLITYLRSRRENEIKHLLIEGSLGELLKGDNYDIRREAVMTGYEKGDGDIIIRTGNKRYSGCFIELKYGNNGLTSEQKYMIKQYKANNYKIIVSSEWTDLQRKVDEYLRDIRIPCDYCKGKFISNKTLRNHLKYFHRHE